MPMMMPEAVEASGEAVGVPIEEMMPNAVEASGEEAKAEAEAARGGGRSLVRPRPRTDGAR